jgi:hypothetical protein
MEGAQVNHQPATEEQTEVERVKQVVMKAIEGDLTEIARLMTSKGDGELFGKTEFELRDIVHRLGRNALEAAVNDRKKGGTKAAAHLAQTAASQPGSWSGGPRPT